MPKIRTRASRWAVATALAALAAATAVAPHVGAQADPASVAEPEAIQILRVSTPSHVHKARLQALDLDLTEHGTRSTVDVVSYGKADQAKLRGAGFSWKVVVADVAEAERLRVAADKAYAAAKPPAGGGLPSGRAAYRTSTDYGTDLAGLAATYPTQTRLFNLSHPSLEGRQVKALEVSNNVAAKDGKPTFLVMGVHHAREWPSGELTIEFAYDLLKNSADPRIKNILDKSRVLFVPIVNPDGFDVSRTQTYEMKRKNCRITDLVLPGAGECQNSSNFSLGTDPNRNYGGFWGGPGASTSKTSETYRGSGAFSEPETQNIQELVSSRQVVTLITNHTYSNLVLRPPGYAAGGITSDETVYKALGDAMAAQMGYTSQYSYQLYDTTGTTEDWSYFATGGLGFTFEHGGNSFHPTFSNVVSMYKGGKKAGGGAREAFPDRCREHRQRRSARGDRGYGAGWGHAAAQEDLRHLDLEWVDLPGHARLDPRRTGGWVVHLARQPVDPARGGEGRRHRGLDAHLRVGDRDRAGDQTGHRRSRPVGHGQPHLLSG